MNSLPLPLLMACGIADLVVGAVILLLPLRGDGPIRSWRLLAAAAGVLAAFVVRIPALLGLGVHRFGWVYIAFIDLAAVGPGLCLLALAIPRIRGRLTAPARWLAAIGILPAAVGGHATFVEPFRLRIETATVAVSAARAGSHPVTVAVLTDLQTDRVTDYERTAIDRLLARKPDLILIPGDILQVAPGDFEERAVAMRELLGRLDAPGGVFVVQGDIDRSPDQLLHLIEGTRLRPLFNEIAETQVGDRRIAIAGVQLDYASPPARDIVRQLAERTDPATIRLVLAHRPDVALVLPESAEIDLVVAGHTHGGQIVIPGFGPPLTLTKVPRRVAAGGLHAIDGHPIYVSRGVGCERGQAPRIRLFCPPEISLLTIDGVHE